MSPDVSLRPAARPEPDKSRTEMLVAGLILRKLRVRAREVVFIKGVIEASEGLAVLFADAGGDLTIATSASQTEELDRLLADLKDETGALLDCNDDDAS